MKIIEDKLKELGATDFEWKNKKDLTICNYKLNGKNKKVTFDGGELSIKVFRVKEKYVPAFTEYKKKTDEACLKVDEEFKPTLEKYKQEVQEVSEAELLRQLEKQV